VRQEGEVCGRVSADHRPPLSLRPRQLCLPVSPGSLARYF